MIVKKVKSRRAFLTLLAGTTATALLPITGQAFTYSIQTPHLKNATIFSRSVSVKGSYTLATSERQLEVHLLAYDRWGNLIAAGTGTRTTLKSGTWQASVVAGTSLTTYQIRYRITLTNGLTQDYRSALYTF